MLLLFVVDGARESGRSRQHTQTPTKQRSTRRSPVAFAAHEKCMKTCAKIDPRLQLVDRPCTLRTAKTTRMTTKASVSDRCHTEMYDCVYFQNRKAGI